MRIVLDTNVFVSGVFFGGVPGQVLARWRDSVATASGHDALGTVPDPALELVVSREILEEYVRVGDQLGQKFPGVDLAPFLELVAAFATFVEAPPLPHPVSPDPDDDLFLAAAVAAKARFVVSGDSDLLEVGSYDDVRISKPRDFLKELER